ncbi:MAG TPA: uroporphyrinogen decarboxylase family protein [Candidatus Sumerlaeota bacterium]|nr:uroporphyrinogen decarboxylase family protein [Candidatus Sumerlaeota bacterium]
MNGIERVQATLTGQAVDRRAVAPVLSLYGARLTGCPLDRYYTDSELYARGQAAVADLFQPDLLFSSFSFASVGAAFGGNLFFSGNQAPNLRRPAILSPEEWDTLVWPRHDTNPHLLYFQETIQRLVEAHGSEVLVAAPVVPPFDVPTLVMGIEGWLRLVLTDRSRARGVLEKCVPFFVEMANSYFEAGAACVVAPCGFMSPSVVTRDIAEHFSRPALAAALPQLKGPIVLHHVGAPMLAHLDLLTGLPSTLGLAVDRQDDLDQARAIAGPDLTIFGGPSVFRMPGYTASEIEADCRALLENRRQDARFILCTAGPDVPWETPPENIQALRRTAESFSGRSVPA